MYFGYSLGSSIKNVCKISAKIDLLPLFPHWLNLSRLPLQTFAPGLTEHNHLVMPMCVHLAMQHSSESATLVLCHGKGRESHLTYLQSQR